PEANAAAWQQLSELLGEAANRRGPAWAGRHLLTVDQPEAVLKQLRARYGPVPQSEFAELYGSADDLRKAAAASHEIGSHTANHRMRHTLTRAEFEHELRCSRAALEQYIQRPVTSFSFPFNSFLFA